MSLSLLGGALFTEAPDRFKRGARQWGDFTPALSCVAHTVWTPRSSVKIIDREDFDRFLREIDDDWTEEDEAAWQATQTGILDDVIDSTVAEMIAEMLMDEVEHERAMTEAASDIENEVLNETIDELAFYIVQEVLDELKREAELEKQFGEIAEELVAQVEADVVEKLVEMVAREDWEQTSIETTMLPILDEITSEVIEEGIEREILMIRETIISSEIIISEVMREMIRLHIGAVVDEFKGESISKNVDEKDVVDIEAPLVLSADDEKRESKKKARASKKIEIIDPLLEEKPETNEQPLQKNEVSKPKEAKPTSKDEEPKHKVESEHDKPKPLVDKSKLKVEEPKPKAEKPNPRIEEAASKIEKSTPKFEESKPSSESKQKLLELKPEESKPKPEEPKRIAEEPKSKKDVKPKELPKAEAEPDKPVAKIEPKPVAPLTIPEEKAHTPLNEPIESSGDELSEGEDDEINIPTHLRKGSAYIEIIPCEAEKSDESEYYESESESNAFSPRAPYRHSDSSEPSLSPRRYRDVSLSGPLSIHVSETPEIVSPGNFTPVHIVTPFADKQHHEKVDLLDSQRRFIKSLHTVKDDLKEAQKEIDSIKAEAEIASTPIKLPPKRKKSRFLNGPKLPQRPDSFRRKGTSSRFIKKSTE